MGNVEKVRNNSKLHRSECKLCIVKIIVSQVIILETRFKLVGDLVQVGSSRIAAICTSSSF